jgi:hypothetical protein
MRFNFVWRGERRNAPFTTQRNRLQGLRMNKSCLIHYTARSAMAERTSVTFRHRSVFYSHCYGHRLPLDLRHRNP